MDVLRLLEEIEDIAEAGSSVPFSQKVMVDKMEILEIVNEIRIKLPDEIKQASWIKSERQRILAEAQEDADNLLKDANYKLEEIIGEHEVIKLAEERAGEILTKAKNNVKEIRIGAMEYADGLLEDTQEELKKVITLLNENRKELRGND